MTDPIDLVSTVVGPADASAVVLVHAIGTSMAMWDPQVAPLAADWRVVRVDLRGHGESPVPPGPYAIAELAADLVGVLDSLGIERASLCGLSLGAMVAARVAAEWPERVDRLIAACLVARPASPEAWLDRASRVREGGTAAVSDLVVERWGYADRAPQLAQRVRDMLAATPAEGYASACEAIAAMDLQSDLRRITAPTLLLAGSDDPSAPPSVGAELAAVIPDARLEVIEGAAHLVNVERPEAMNAAIQQHLRR